MDVNTVTKIDDEVRIRNVLISTADKRGLDKLVTGLVSAVPELRIYSTGGTFKRISEILGTEAGAHLTAVADYTGQPEMQGGLVKTLDFKIYLGLLSETYNGAHTEDLRRCRAVAFDMVVANLYPFRRTIAQPGSSIEDARGNIDIGGPSMIRAAAKNYLRVAVVCDPGDYPRLVDQMSAHDGRLAVDTRFRLAARAFAHTAEYDAAIASYFERIDVAAVRDSYELQK